MARLWMRRPDDLGRSGCCCCGIWRSARWREDGGTGWAHVAALLGASVLRDDASMLELGVRAKHTVSHGSGVEGRNGETSSKSAGWLDRSASGSPPRSRISLAMSLWRPVASMVTNTPVGATFSRCPGIASISSDLTWTAVWPSTGRRRFARADTTCNRPRNFLSPIRR